MKNTEERIQIKNVTIHLTLGDMHEIITTLSKASNVLSESMQACFEGRAKEALHLQTQVLKCINKTSCLALDRVTSQVDTAELQNSVNQTAR